MIFEEVIGALRRGYGKTFAYIVICALLAVCFIGASYVFGAVSYHRELWPIPELRAFKQMESPYTPTNGAIADKYNRLVGFRGKEQISCPPQTDRTMVLLTAGQSNAANSGGQRYAGGPGVVNYFAGKCYAASSPLLGATGIYGDSWTLLGNKIIENHLATQVILVATAVSGTSIDRWQDGADLNLMLRSVISDVKSHYRITHILWHQGEWDAGGAMTQSLYRERFMSLVASIRMLDVDAPIFVSVATHCELTDTPWEPNNSISAAQRELPDITKKIYQGVDTDALLGPLDRMDDCHFSQSGQEKFARAWVDKLMAKGIEQ